MMHRLALAVALGLIIETTVGRAAKAPLSVTVAYRLAYDNNLFKYSPRDRARFLDRTETHLSPMHSLDDLRHDLKVTAAYKDPRLLPRPTQIQVTTNLTRFSYNPLRDFFWVSVTGRGDLTDELGFGLNYYSLPKYYLRDFRDRHDGEYHRCTYGLNQWTGRLYVSPSKMADFTAWGRLRYYFYNKYFTEYDGEAETVGLDGAWRLGRFRLSGGWAFTKFTNTGYDTAEIRGLTGLEPEDSEFGQSNFEEDRYSLSLQYVTKVWKHTFLVTPAVTFERRYFTTSRTPDIDPLHSGRKDKVTGTEVAVKYFLRRGMSLECGWEYESRGSRASVPLTEDLKTYHRWGMWTELSVQLR